ncbi:MAG: YHS domain-containing protein [Candidatus Omnitrophota bacterium]
MRFIIAFFVAAFVFGINSSVFAHCGKCGVGEAAEGEATHMMENKVCMCGMELDKKTSVHEEYEGKTYHFCHTDCAAKFKANPAEGVKMISEKNM